MIKKTKSDPKFKNDILPVSYDNLEDFIMQVDDFDYRSTDEDIKDNLVSVRFTIPKDFYEVVKTYCVRHNITLTSLIKVAIRDYKLEHNQKVVSKVKIKVSQQLKIYLTEYENYHIDLYLTAMNMDKKDFYYEAIKWEMNRRPKTKEEQRENLFNIYKDLI